MPLWVRVVEKSRDSEHLVGRPRRPMLRASRGRRVGSWTERGRMLTNARKRKLRLIEQRWSGDQRRFVADGFLRLHCGV